MQKYVGLYYAPATAGTVVLSADCCVVLPADCGVVVSSAK